MRQMGIMFIWIIETNTNTLDLSLSFFLSLFIMVVKNTHKKLSWITIDWKLTRLKSTLSTSNQFNNRHSRNLRKFTDRRNNHEDIRLKLPHNMTCLFLLSSVHYQKLCNCTFTHPKGKELWINKLKEIWKY